LESAKSFRAHIFLSPHTHRAITTELARRGFDVFALDYRKCPKDPFPAAIEDALAAYVSLLPKSAFESPILSGLRASIAQLTIPVVNQKIVIMGDSSGGCLSLQTLMVLRELGLRVPSSLVLLSPFVDNGEFLDYMSDIF
jgi:acetyl esterase/lipase